MNIMPFRSVNIFVGVAYYFYDMKPKQKRKALGNQAPFMIVSFAERLLREGRFRLVSQRLEGFRFMHRDISEHLAINLNASLGQAVNEAGIGEIQLAARGVNALNPERAEIALADAAVAISVLASLFHRLIGDAESVFAAAVIAFGFADDFLVAGVGGDASFHT